MIRDILSGFFLLLSIAGVLSSILLMSNLAFIPSFEAFVTMGAVTLVPFSAGMALFCSK